MFRKTLLCAVVLAAAVMVYAQDEKKTTTVTGYVIDNMCADSHGSDGEAKEHETSCSLMKDGRKSGYAVVSKGVVYKLDAAGSRRVLKMLKETKTKTGFEVKIEGTINGETLSIDNIEEVRP